MNTVQHVGEVAWMNWIMVFDYTYVTLREEASRIFPHTEFIQITIYFFTELQILGYFIPDKLDDITYSTIILL